MSRPARLALFALATLALALAAIASGHGGGGAASSSKSSPAITAAAPAPSDPPPLEPRPFLRAFLRYEVGRLGASGSRRLREMTSAAFARQLLSSAPVGRRPTAGAGIRRLRVTYLSRTPPRALVTGSARRDGRPEQFAFLFEARAGVWLASGAGA